MPEAVMTFGKHRGERVEEVPLEYLLWAASSLADPPPCVVEELKRRAGMHGSRGAVEAASAVASLLFSQSTKKGKARKSKWKRRKIRSHYRNR